MYTYDREIVCFPNSFVNRKGLIQIPRKKSVRNYLVINKLIGNVRLRSDMTEDELMSEIRSVFSLAMKQDSLFNFKILQTCGGGSRALSERQVSSSFQWTASTIAGKNSKCPIYILAEDELSLVKDETSGVEEIIVCDSEDDLPAINVRSKGKGEKRIASCFIDIILHNSIHAYI